MNKLSNKVILAITISILTFMIVVQTRSIKMTGHNLNKWERDYIEEINSVKEVNKKLKSDIESLNKRANELVDKISKDDNIAKEMNQQLEEAKILSGNLAVKGPGVIITIKTLVYSDLINNFLYNYKYILDIISYLNISESEAIAINNVRITPYTSIIRGNNFLMIDNKIIKGPLVIKAIGNSDKMISSLKFIGSPIVTLKNSFDFEIKIEKNNDIHIPATELIRELKHIE